MIRKALEGYLLCMGSRKVVLPIYTWPAMLCMILSSRGFPPLLELLKVVVAVTFVGYAVYFYNDVMDVMDDLKNRELGNPIPASRPFASGKVSKGMMALYILLSAIVGLSVAYLINPRVLTLMAIYIILGVLYSTDPVRLKKRFLMKQLVIASGNALAHLSGAYAAQGLNPAVIYLTTLDFLLVVGVNPVLDIRDMRGDSLLGVKTVPVVFGPRVAVRLAISVLAASSVATLIGYSRLGFNLAMPLLFLVIAAALIYTFYPLMEMWRDSIYLDRVVYRRALPLYLLLQVTVLIGIIPL